MMMRSPSPSSREEESEDVSSRLGEQSVVFLATGERACLKSKEATTY